MNAPFPDSLLLLSELRRGQSAVVEEIDAGLAEGAHLASMGLTVGSVVHVIVPGHPCAVVVGQTRLMLRCAQVAAIRVSLL